jgi:hypothetical protein
MSNYHDITYVIIRIRKVEIYTPMTSQTFPKITIVDIHLLEQGVNRIHLTPCRTQWQARVSTVMNHPVP